MTNATPFAGESISKEASWRFVGTFVRVAVLAALATPAWSQQNPSDLADKSLEDLMNIQVTTVSKKEQSLFRAPSAVFVITAEDIHRSGATNIPDLLRMVPGMDVAQIDENTWAISTRGFNERFSNELQVLVDGRPVYTPTFGGVFWDTLNVPMDDIERIEVIRGPGGSVWGANAVNGVVNIITKKVGDTQGALVVLGGGNLHEGFGTLQYGGKLGKKTDYRVDTNYFNRSHLPNLNDQDGGDGWHLLRGAFRLDSTISPKDTLMIQGDLYTGREGKVARVLPSVTSPGVQDEFVQVNLSGGFVQANWKHAYSARSDVSLQFSLNSYERDDLLREGRKTMNLDFLHHFAWAERNDIVWGIGYQFTSSESDGNLTVSLNPANLNTQLFSGFIQDEFSVLPNRLSVTVGAKIEHNHYTDFHFMPTVRAAWTPSGRYMFWAAISNATRTPSSVDTALRANLGNFPGPGGTPVLLRLVGNPSVKDEGLVAYEAGYRATIGEKFSIDLTAYYFAYDHQETTEPSTPFSETTPAPPHIVMPLVYQNLMQGESHGLEIYVNWKVTSRWTVSPSYAFQRIHMHLVPPSLEFASVSDAEGSSPVHSAQIRSHLDLPYHLSWDTSVSFVGRLTDQEIPSYTRLDTQFTWLFSKQFSLSVAGQNLARDHHAEFIDPVSGEDSSLIKRSGYAKLTWRF